MGWIPSDCCYFGCEYGVDSVGLLLLRMRVCPYVRVRPYARPLSRPLTGPRGLESALRAQVGPGPIGPHGPMGP